MKNRNINFVKQLKLSFLFKILSVCISFLLVRYMLQYLGVELYGIWAVLLTFINWIIFFDFGISNGVKNKVALCLSKDDFFGAREYISTGYIILFIFSLIVYIIFFLISDFINWQIIFNTHIIANKEFTLITNTILLFILLNFVLSIISSVLNAIQKASIIVLQQFLSQLFALIFILILINFTNKSIIYIAMSYGISLLLSNILITIYFYKKNTKLIPDISNFRRNKTKSILSLGMKFFYLQLTIMLILSTDTIIITQLLDSTYVTKYDILLKYFGALMILHNVINTPLWSMYTEAYSKNDYNWISNILKKMVLLMIAYLAIGSLLYFYRDILFDLWLGQANLNITDMNYIYMFIMTCILIWYTTFAYFTNGINKTNNQMISATIGVIINIPLSIYFVKYLSMGLNGVMLATIISLSVFGFTGVIQAIYEIKLMKEKDNI